MLLQKLKEYADQRMALPPPLYAETPIGYVIELGEDGRPLNSAPVSRKDASSPTSKRGVRRLAPDVVRSSGVKPLLLADTSEYTFGIARDPAKRARANECHLAYRQLLDDCAAATKEPTVLAVQAFYRHGGKKLLQLPDDFDLEAKVTFQVSMGLDAVFPIDLPPVQAFWAAKHDPGAAGAPRMQCLVCGLERPVVTRLQAKIKGVRGGHRAGTSIISANADAFESYGLRASRVAPTCPGCGERFTRAANELIAGPATHLYLGPTTFIFWTKDETGFDAARLISKPEPGDVRGLVDSVRSGRLQPALKTTDFYAATLSGSGGRIVVRDWIDTTVAEAQRRIARWFELQRIVGASGQEPWSDGSSRPLGLRALARATVRKVEKDLPVTTARALLRSALTATPPPPGLLAEAMRRNHAEQGVTRPRAALIKLVLLGQDTTYPEDYMVALDPGHPSKGYQCGRLLATLERVQRTALPRINATIIDRFFGSASTSPATVFPRLVRGAQPHLSRLERDRPGAFFALQARLEHILGQLKAEAASAYPIRLGLAEQGLFSLGYYHQRAADRAAAAEARLRRERGEKPADDMPDVDDETDETADQTEEEN